MSRLPPYRTMTSWMMLRFRPSRLNVMRVHPLENECRFRVGIPHKSTVSTIADSSTDIRGWDKIGNYRDPTMSTQTANDIVSRRIAEITQPLKDADGPVVRK